MDMKITFPGSLAVNAELKGFTVIRFEVVTVANRPFNAPRSTLPDSFGMGGG